jgi:hypothetical protein
MEVCPKKVHLIEVYPIDIYYVGHGAMEISGYHLGHGSTDLRLYTSTKLKIVNYWLYSPHVQKTKLIFK